MILQFYWNAIFFAEYNPKATKESHAVLDASSYYLLIVCVSWIIQKTKFSFWVTKCRRLKRRLLSKQITIIYHRMMQSALSVFSTIFYSGWYVIIRSVFYSSVKCIDLSWGCLCLERIFTREGLNRSETNWIHRVESSMKTWKKLWRDTLWNHIIKKSRHVSFNVI